jgi:hypothetical protein
MSAPVVIRSTIIAVTTPDTSAVRAWARSNGYDVADRGRLPTELTDAYLAAQGDGGKSGQAGKPDAAKKAAAKKAAAKKAAARKAPAKKAAAKKPAAKSVSTPAAPTAAAPKAAEPKAEPARAEPKPSPVSDDRRLVALGEQLAALTDRVAALEKSVGSKSNGKSGGMRFRRSR